MNPQDAGRIVTLLVAKFHRDALEPESQIQFARDVALLHDYEIGIVAADELARSQDRFPTIREYRDAYHHVARRRAGERSESHGLPQAKPGEIPEWVHVWTWARFTREPAETRLFPQEVEPEGGLPLGPPEDYLLPSDYALLHLEWTEAGAPKLASASRLAGQVRRRLDDQVRQD